MNKETLIENAASKSGLTKKDTGKALDAILGTITEALAAGDKVQLVGFGNFEVSERSARKGRNPQTGEEVTIPKSNLPKFKAGAKLKNAIPQPN